MLEKSSFCENVELLLNAPETFPLLKSLPFLNTNISHLN
jgi:hypothetical protein